MNLNQIYIHYGSESSIIIFILRFKLDYLKKLSFHNLKKKNSYEDMFTRKSNFIKDKMMLIFSWQEHVYRCSSIN